ncbi:hypothetical protein [Undibacterium sp.]|uniref:hypothetical protein n=1 Tax=Undibacterium sp. TaxID=1914977 RepID=UPI00375139E6
MGTAICTAPTYPKNSFSDNEQGAVALDVEANSERAITNATITQSGKFESLDKAIKEYLLCIARKPHRC